MGYLKEGNWIDKWYDTTASKGAFVRRDSSFRSFIKHDGSSPYLAESGRYHLYLSHACPWAHRVLIFLILKNLTSTISYSYVNPLMLENGWTFDSDNEEYGDPLYHKRFLYELYLKSTPDYYGRVTVPVLWDKTLHCIVNNESSDIIRMLNSEFNDFSSNSIDYYPSHLRDKIDTINQFVYNHINNGVYKCGFATTQSAYNHAFNELFNALDYCEDLLSKQRYLVENTLTEADWRLFTTLIRFDSVYVGHFKCNKKRVIDYPNLFKYLNTLLDMDHIRDTVFMNFIKLHYYGSHRHLNPYGIVPLGPEDDLTVVV